MERVLTIAFGNRTVRFGEIFKGWTKIDVKRLFEREIPDGIADKGYILDCEAAANFLRSVILEEEIKIKNAIFIIPAGKVMTREILLPKMSDRDILNTIKTNKEDYFPAVLEDCVTACFKTGEISEKTDNQEEKERRKFYQVTALAAPDAMIEGYFETASKAGLKVAALEYEGNSLFHMVMPQMEDETCAAVRIKEEGFSLSVFCEKTMIFQRNVSYTPNNQKYDSSRILSEMKRAIGYCRLDRPDMEISRLYFAGWEQDGGNMQKELEKKAGLPLCEISLWKGLNIHLEAETAEENKYLENIGAAISPLCFLSKREEKKAERKREKEFCRCLLFLAVFISLAAIAGPAAEVLSLSAEKMELESRLLSFHGVDDIFKEYKEAEKRQKDAEEIAEISSIYSYDPKKFADSLEEILPDGVVVTYLSWDKDKAEISAVSDEKEEAVFLVRRMKEMDQVRDVDISGLSSTFEDDGKEDATFTITCFIEDQTVEEGEKEVAADEEFNF